MSLLFLAFTVAFLMFIFFRRPCANVRITPYSNLGGNPCTIATTKMSVNLQTKTLIENWVEERQVAHLEEGNRQPDGTLSTALHRQGHKGILTTDTDSPVSKTSAVRETYKSPEGPKMRMNGSRREALQKSLYEMVAKEVEEEFHPPPPPVELISTTQHDYSLDFQPCEQPPTKPHDLYKEQPLTYWRSNISDVMGVSKICTKNEPFRKNTDFSTPIEHQMNQTDTN